jgi:4-diphosphocytidyl-2-C-methyl-D-erythritol kinase
VAVLYDVPAPAKLNLFLHVVGRRPDGYHLLQSVFRFIDLYDYLTFEMRSDGVIECESPIEGLKPEDDLVVKAARALRLATGVKAGVQIHYRKTIPSGGGLGGGSSNAASTLIALNRLWNTGLSRDELMRLALPLGADVPVFVFGQSAFAQGIGEDLQRVELGAASYLVVQPGQHVATGSVFSDPNLTRDTKPIIITDFAEWQTLVGLANTGVHHSAGLQHEVPAHGMSPVYGRNDLQPVVFARYPIVKQANNLLLALGLKPRMTGSGACLFVQFVTSSQAQAYQQKIVGKIACYVNDTAKVINNTWVCSGLNEHPLYHWLNS